MGPLFVAGYNHACEDKKKEIDKLTDMLRYMVEIFDTNIGYEYLREDIQEWWKSQKDKK